MPYFVFSFTKFHTPVHRRIEGPQLTKFRGLSPRANYTDRAAAAGRRSQCQLLRIEGCHVVSATDPQAVKLCFLDRSRYFFYSSSSSIDLTRLSGPRSRPTTTQKIWQRRESNPKTLYLQPETLTTRPQRRSLKLTKHYLNQTLTIISSNVEYCEHSKMADKWLYNSDSNITRKKTYWLPLTCRFYNQNLF